MNFWVYIALLGDLGRRAGVSLSWNGAIKISHGRRGRNSGRDDTTMYYGLTSPLSPVMTCIDGKAGI